MVVSLAKGGNVSLTKQAPGLKNVTVGLGWDIRITDGADFDLDSVVFLVGADQKVTGDGDFIFYNNPVSGCGSVRHAGDNRTGAGDGDDEQIKVNLTQVPAAIHKIIIGVTIHDGEARRQNFGMVNRAFARVVNDDGGAELARFDLSEDASVETSMIFGELYRHNDEWKFRAIGQGFAGGLGPMARAYGVNA